MSEGGDHAWGKVMFTTEPETTAAAEASTAPRRVHRRAAEPGVQAACRRVLGALDGLTGAEQLRVLRAAALLLVPDDVVP